MAGETTITIVGNLTDDPELRFTPSGAAVANFTVASTPRNFDKRPTSGTTATPCSCAARSGARPPRTSPSPSARHRVVVQGRLKAGSYTTKTARSAPCWNST